MPKKRLLVGCVPRGGSNHVLWGLTCQTGVFAFHERIAFGRTTRPRRVLSPAGSSSLTLVAEARVLAWKSSFGGYPAKGHADLNRKDCAVVVMREPTLVWRSWHDFARRHDMVSTSSGHSDRWMIGKEKFVEMMTKLLAAPCGCRARKASVLFQFHEDSLRPGGQEAALRATVGLADSDLLEHPYVDPVATAMELFGPDKEGSGFYNPTRKITLDGERERLREAEEEFGSALDLRLEIADNALERGVSEEDVGLFLDYYKEFEA